MNRTRSTWSVDGPGFGDQYRLVIRQGQSDPVAAWLGELPECLELATAFERLGCVQAGDGDKPTEGDRS